MIVCDPEELELLREGGRILAGILQKIAEKVRPGASAAELDAASEQMILKAGGVPSFKGYQHRKDPRPYPSTLCVSVNDELVHALPSREKIFKQGDIVGIDIGMKYPAEGGLFTDTAVTVGVGLISADANRLLQATRESLEIGLQAIRPGVRTGDIGFAIQKHLENMKLGVVKNLAGHGVGGAVHEEPLVPNFGTPGQGVEIVEGMVLAIEPMATLGNGKTELAEDGWAYRSSDRTLAAHFEHTIVVVKDGVEILTRINDH